MTIAGITVDNPLDNLEVIKRTYSTYKEGTRTTIQSVWLDSYIKEGNAITYEAHNLTMTNRGVCELDGKPLKDKANLDFVKGLFDTLAKS